MTLQTLPLFPATRHFRTLRAAMTLSALSLAGFASAQIARPAGDLLAAASSPAAFAALASTSSPLASVTTAPAESTSASEALPDAPSALLAPSADPQTKVLNASTPPATPPGQGAPGATVAPKHLKYIPAGWTAQPITAHDKVIIGLRDLYSPENFLAMIFAAGYEQVENGQPNYGTDRGAFGERLGAAAIRESAQGIFTDTVFSPLLRQDPRYYIQGPQRNTFYRIIYAGTRPLISRTDSGRSVPNTALLAGYASSAALSLTFAPQINRNFNDAASAFGGSIGGAAIGFLFSEFSDSLLQDLHLAKKK